jgi:hypothetical protein
MLIPSEARYESNPPDAVANRNIMCHSIKLVAN